HTPSTSCARGSAGTSTHASSSRFRAPRARSAAITTDTTHGVGTRRTGSRAGHRGALASHATSEFSQPTIEAAIRTSSGHVTRRSIRRGPTPRRSFYRKCDTPSDVNEQSFMKAVFHGVVAEDLIFPYPEMPPEDRENTSMILDSVRRFFDANVDSA